MAASKRSTDRMTTQSTPAATRREASTPCLRVRKRVVSTGRICPKTSCWAAPVDDDATRFELLRLVIEGESYRARLKPNRARPTRRPARPTTTDCRSADAADGKTSASPLGSDCPSTRARRLRQTPPRSCDFPWSHDRKKWRGPTTVNSGTFRVVDHESPNPQRRRNRQNDRPKMQCGQ